MSRFVPNPALFGMTVAKYIRCSHDDQVSHGETLEAQDSILDEFIEVNRMILVDTFIDEATTARKRLSSRKDFSRLMNCVKSQSFQMIIFTKLDRWFRNIADYYKTQEVLEANSVQWKAVTEQYDTTTANGRLYINIRLSVAQDECDRDSERIKDVFAHKLKNKTYITGKLPRGLKLDEGKHVIIDPEWNQFALDMFDHFEATCSKRSTLLYLKEKYNMYLCYDTISRNLKNTLYKGEYRGDPDFCPPTIPPERFDRIQKLAVRNVRKRHTNQTYIFAGLLVCADCDHYLVGTVTYGKLADGSEKVYKNYRCNQRAQSHSCTHGKHHREELIEEYLLSHIRPALSEYIAHYEVTAAAADKPDPAAEAAKVQRKLKKLYDLFMDDLIGKEEYRCEYEKFQKQLTEIKAKPAAPVRDLSGMKSLLSGDWQDVYSTFSDQEKNTFWKSFIDRIVVHEDNSMDISFL